MEAIDCTSSYGFLEVKCGHEAQQDHLQLDLLQSSISALLCSYNFWALAFQVRLRTTKKS